MHILFVSQQITSRGQRFGRTSGLGTSDVSPDPLARSVKQFQRLRSF